VCSSDLARNKKSIGLNLREARAKEILLELVASTQILVENFRPGRLEEMGLGPDVLHERNPSLVIVRISGFGQTGPYRDRPAHDLSVNALAGIASLSVDPDGKPTMPCIPPSDLAGSLMALSGILMALLKRAQTGEGDYVDIGMFDAALSWTPHVVGRVFADGVAPQPSAERTQGGAAFYRPYRTKDGRYITLGGGEIKFASNFLEGIGRPDLIPLAKEPPGEPQAALDRGPKRRGEVGGERRRLVMAKERNWARCWPTRSSIGRSRTFSRGCTNTPCRAVT